MSDAFSSHGRSLSDPAITIFDISPSDTADLAQVTTALNVSSPGTVRVTMSDGSVGDLSIYPGQAFPVRARRVWATGTTATGIRGLS